MGIYLSREELARTEGAESLGLRGDEVYDVEGIGEGVAPHQSIGVRARRDPQARNGVSPAMCWAGQVHQHRGMTIREQPAHHPRARTRGAHENDIHQRTLCRFGRPRARFRTWDGP